LDFKPSSRFDSNSIDSDSGQEDSIIDLVFCLAELFASL
jgi:hypothetical protein